MKRSSELIDIRMTNDRQARKRRRMDDYRRRAAKRREERRLLMLFGSGVVRRWRR